MKPRKVYVTQFDFYWSASPEALLALVKEVLKNGYSYDFGETAGFKMLKSKPRGYPPVFCLLDMVEAPTKFDTEFELKATIEELEEMINPQKKEKD
jgi:hypothetical protein